MDVLQQIASLHSACVCKQEIRRYIDPLTATLSFHQQFTNAYIICGMWRRASTIWKEYNKVNHAQWQRYCPITDYTKASRCNHGRYKSHQIRVARWKTKPEQKQYLPELSVCRPILAINPPHNTTPKFDSKTKRNPTNQSINQSYKHIASSSLLHLLPRNLQRAQHETGKIDLEKQQNETKRNQETEKKKES